MSLKSKAVEGFTKLFKKGGKILKKGEKATSKSSKAIKSSSRISKKASKLAKGGAKDGGKLSKGIKVGGTAVGVGGFAGLMSNLFNGVLGGKNGQFDPNASGLDPAEEQRRLAQAQKEKDEENARRNKSNSEIKTKLQVSESRERSLQSELSQSSDSIEIINDKIRKLGEENRRLIVQLREETNKFDDLKKAQYTAKNNREPEILQKQIDKVNQEIKFIETQIKYDEGLVEEAESNKSTRGIVGAKKVLDADKSRLEEKKNERENLSVRYQQVINAKLDTVTDKDISDQQSVIANIQLTIQYNESQISKLRQEKDELSKHSSDIQNELNRQADTSENLENKLQDYDRTSLDLGGIKSSIVNNAKETSSLLGKIGAGLLLLPMMLDGIKYMIDEGFANALNSLHESVSDLANLFDITGSDEDEVEDNLSTKEGAQKTLQNAKDAKQTALNVGAISMGVDAVEGAAKGTFTKKGWSRMNQQNKDLRNQIKDYRKLKAESKAAAKAAKKEASKQVEKGLAKATEKGVGKSATKAAAKAIGKTATKTILKRVPIIGTLMGLGFAVDRATHGDWAGAGLEALSGAAGLLDMVVPGLGVATGLAVDGIIAARDYNKAKKVEAKAKDALVGFDEKDGKKVNDFLAKNKNIKDLAKDGKGDTVNNILNDKKINVSGTIDKEVTALTRSGVFTASNKIDTDKFDTNLSRVIGDNTSLIVDRNKAKTEFYYLKFIGLMSVLDLIQQNVPNFKVLDSWSITSAKLLVKRLPFSGVIINNQGLLVNLAGGKFKEMIDEYFRSVSSILNNIESTLGATADALNKLTQGGPRKEYLKVLSRVNTNLSVLSDIELSQIKKKIIATLAIKSLNNLNDIIDPNEGKSPENMKQSEEDLTGTPYDYNESKEEAEGDYGPGGAQGRMIPISDGKQKENAFKAIDFFRSKGLTTYQASGLVGNFMRESNMNPTAVNPSSGAYGIAQWLGTRKRKLFDKYGSSPTLEQQLEFVWDEMTSNYSTAWKKLSTARNTDEAADIVFGNYEFGPQPMGTTPASDAMSAVAEMNKHGQGGAATRQKGLDNARSIDDAYNSSMSGGRADTSVPGYMIYAVPDSVKQKQSKALLNKMIRTDWTNPLNLPTPDYLKPKQYKGPMIISQATPNKSTKSSDQNMLASNEINQKLDQMNKKMEANLQLSAGNYQLAAYNVAKPTGGSQNVEKRSMSTDYDSDLHNDNLYV